VRTPGRPATGSVAAHSPDTAAAGAAILEAGGTAADAVAAMTLAACVAEPLVVSLLSGMHALHVDGDGVVGAIDGFVDVPAVVDGGRRAETEVVFDDQRVPYTIGGATFGVPGLVAGCAALVEDHGRLPWAAVVAPALDLAGRGVVLGPEDEALLDMLEPVMRLDTGAAVFCHPDGRLRRAGDRVRLPGIDGLLAQLAAEGPASLVTGDLAHRLADFCAERGSLVTAADLAALRAVRHTPPAVPLGRWVVRSRRGLSPLTDWVAALDARPAGEPDVVALAAVQQPGLPAVNGTTSLAAVDAEGRACAVTASLGLGTGDWFEGCQLNSMLGEVDLLPGGLLPRRRMGSMMAPTAVLAGSPAGARVVAVLGAAGGSRIPSALLRSLHGLTIGGLGPAEAVDLPRLHRMGDVVHVEPHLPAADEAALQAAGYDVRRWRTRNHFFGGVSVATPEGACGDPRRGGDQAVVDPSP
jgi:gamma-glutamyltranspeptidase/glutathione hydrolase